jgi:energy-coupling factor transporter ATP-binding protein EcfA2
MPDLDRIFAQYEKGLQQLHEDLAAGLVGRPEEREYLDLLHHLMSGLLSSYASYRLARQATLDAHISVMYAAAGETGGRVLDVPLRSLVEHGTLTSWQSRYLQSSLGMKRTVLVAGAAGTGRSTLLNSLVQLLPLDQRVVAVEGARPLPALKDRAFAVRLSGEPGSAARQTSMKKAAAMLPTWLLVDDLQTEDATAFLETVTGEPNGLASLLSEDASATLHEWVSARPELLGHLRAASPLLVTLALDQGGRPRVMGLHEVSVEEGQLRLDERRPPENV